MSDGRSFMDDLTRRQQDVLGAIATGQDGGHPPKVLAALEELGLIESYKATLPGALPVEITRWEVPVPVHMRWAQWCADQPSGVDEA